MRPERINPLFMSGDWIVYKPNRRDEPATVLLRIEHKIHNDAWSGGGLYQCREVLNHEYNRGKAWKLSFTDVFHSIKVDCTNMSKTLYGRNV